MFSPKMRFICIFKKASMNVISLKRDVLIGENRKEKLECIPSSGSCIKKSKKLRVNKIKKK
jgi:hypothetical protein